MQQGLTEDMYAHVDKPEQYEDFTEPERLAIEFAERFAVDHRNLDEAFFSKLREHFTDVEIVELATTIAFCLGVGRVYTVLEIANECPVTMS
ncbi:MAG: hypothetical protein CL467_00390 [Acidimicrobiaceae bacterium]|nr:hypothetical protein [Acidimicrobiaceae bacterium]|tara:strand:- start:6887 stop:7162 length:276 start_codon:yes stop_codon:yes gene_type:complete